MDKHIRMAKRRRKLLVAGLVLATAGAIVIFLNRPLADPKLIDSRLSGLTLVPRSKFGKNSVIDIPWFGGRFTYPKPVQMPRDWQDNPLASGYLEWPHVEPSVSEMHPLMVGMAQWISEEGESVRIVNRLQPLGAYTYAYVPYVFGTKPMRFQVGSESLHTLNPFKIELPPLGWSPPPAEPYRIKIAGGEVSFTRKKWIGPWFAAEFEVTALGLPANSLIFGRSVLSDSDTSVPTRFHMQPDKASRIYSNRPDEQFEILHVKASQEPIEVVISGTSFQTCEVIDKSKRIIGRGHQSSQGWTVGVTSPKEVAAFALGKDWIGPNYMFHDPENSDIRWEGVIQKLSPGKQKATLYRVVSREVVTLKGFLPKVPLPKH